MNISYSFGMIDLLHFGHINALKKASENADLKVFGLVSDESSDEWFSTHVSLEQERRAVLEGIRYVDIVMPRKDYDRLIEYFRENEEELYPYKLYHYSVQNDYSLSHARIGNLRYPIVSKVYKKPKKQSVFIIDISPLDYSNNIAVFSEKLNTIWINCLYYSGLKLMLNNAPSRRYYLLFVLWFPFARLFHKYFSSYREKYFSNTDDNCKYMGAFALPIYGYKEVFEKDVFSSTIQVEFEGNSFSCFKEYDRILTQLYGDYMTLPPEEQRVGRHSFEAYETLE